MEANFLSLELNDKKNKFESYLSEWASNRPEKTPVDMWESMIYSLKVGGKRIRPILCMTSTEMFGMSSEKTMPMALSLEMVHTASLIHDDLPAMDNDDLRRGKPTNHVMFGEAMAILAGDALLCHAFEYAMQKLPCDEISWERITRALANFAKALGPSGMCGGQVLDMEGESDKNNVPDPISISTLKTAALIRTSIASGAILAGAEVADLSALDDYGLNLGIAFQVADDILDVTGSKDQIGKSIGKDKEQGKKTFVSVYGMDGARKMLEEKTMLSVENLAGFGEKARFLRELSLFLEKRTR